jgi:ectoine hydroxylase-related dioxygenase (phytanoyl-CoA dioxygenase family)
MSTSYQPFRDSSDIKTDGPALQARMKEDGYLFVKGIYPKEMIANLRRQMLGIAAEAGWLKKGTAIEESIAEPSSACADPEPRYLVPFKKMYRLEDFHAAAHHPNVIGLMERLIGAKVAPHARTIQRNMFPQRPDFTTPAHQDFPHIQGTADTYSVWAPLGDCPVERGGLMMAEGSHKEGVLPFRLSTGAGGKEVPNPYEGRWRASGFEAGDAIIFHSMMVHKALPNVSTNLRQSIDNRYQAVHEPIVEASLLPYASVMPWEEIYAGWSSDRHKYYWKDTFKNIVPFSQKYYEERDEIAFKMAEEGNNIARAALLRIVQRDTNATKRERAARLLERLEKVA